MLKAYRLKNRGSFTYIYSRGTSISSPIMALIHVPSRNLKLGVSVSKKIGKSVVRNKVKRRINESFMRLAPYIVGNYNYVAVARTISATSTFLDILKALEYLLRKKGHIQKSLDLDDVMQCAKRDPKESVVEPKAAENSETQL